MEREIIAARLAEEFGSFTDILIDWARAQPDATALVDDRRDIAWAELVGLVERLAARLVETGLERGQSVAILGTSSVEYALVFLAAVRAGGVAAPLTTSASRDQLEGMARDSGARHLFIDAGKAAELGPDFMAEMQRVPLEEIERWMAPPGARAPAIDPAPGDPFNIIYSSGTTGIPKGIVHSHRMRWRQFAATALSYLGAGIEVRSLASTPLYSNTTMVAFLPVLLAGGTVRIMGKFDPARWLDHAAADRTTVTMLVPVQYQRLMDFERLDEFDLSALALKYCTSAPFSPELKREVLRRMPGGLIEIYSMTEGGVVCLLPAHEFPDKLHTVGRPAPGSELKVLDDEDREVPPGTPGHLVGRSQTMMLGYRNRPDKTLEAQWTDPATGEVWMRMGDIGRVDADGFVELVGRAKDMIISGGFNIYPSDLEAELMKEPEVVEAAVVGAASRRWGESPVGFVRLAAGAREPGAILEAVNRRLGKTQRLAALHRVEEMPRSHIGKLLKSELRETAERLGGVA
ncbi:class I adenylate-forming enzyme family protein [Erythrobacter sp. HL-111]|uniref:class I adenylate-forming enzyme family protein n=1 Tax=Erythrobacter sp. HL-111 TaxID=1798193 RepID=UPI0006D9B052|nr:class I adenylate-forming enzyme family protein [Erythrobacter sp. HL-111]KPP94794.1 MAG: Acyl-CoA synthetases (AMP-forming)/AMP-acid ligases II [Erythrobacteraceae bacterium HL-111]SDS85496.1 Acyl-CoA synthetase (AMP-forming)/AMP-acid ligase II [Erythrobacter sp. HL-111]